MEAEHDSLMAGHFGTYKTIGTVRANFYWPKMDEQMREYVNASRKLSPPPPTFLIQIPTLPHFASGSNPPPTSPLLLALMANPHNLPPGNEAFGRLSALKSPLPSRSGTPSTDQPMEFMMRQLAQARSALRLSNQDFPDLSPDAQAGTLPIESITMVLLSQLVKGLVTVSHELSGVTQAVATISEENENLREELHDISSQLANRPHTQEQQTAPVIADLQASIHDLSYCVSAPTPAPPALAPPPQRTPQPHPTAGPPPQRKAKKGPLHHPHLPQPRLTTLNTLYHSTIRDLARGSVTPRSTPSSILTHTKPGNSGREGTTLTPSPQATSTVTFTPPPLTRTLLPAQARAARAKARLRSLLPPNLLPVRRPLLLKRGLPPFQVPNDASLPLASPLPLTQTLPPLPLPFLTLLLASSANQTASAPWVSLPLSTPEDLSP